MRDQRIIEMLEGRKKPEPFDLPLLERVVDKEGCFYNPTELLALQSYIVSLKKKIDEIGESFAMLEKSDLKISRIICTVCGHAIDMDDKESKLCQHLKKDLVEGF